jgi:hypothetical protein
MAQRARRGGRRARTLAVLAAAVACGTVLLVPAGVGAAAAITHRSSSQVTAARQVSGLTAADIADAAQPVSGMPAVGALFTETNGKLGTHFCSASVVHSTGGDLAVTAAHCITGTQGQTVFVPGYANGKEPYGVWPVTAVYTDQAWQSSQDPDNDIAFLKLAANSSGTPVEKVTGAEQLAAGTPEPVLVQVPGYPDGATAPVSCVNYAKSFSATQLEFDCGGYTDGTSGSPFLAGVSKTTGLGTIIAVIGGYEQGGNTPDVSYGAAIGTTVTALYHTAEAGG